jgi:hypothetical protein
LWRLICLMKPQSFQRWSRVYVIECGSLDPEADPGVEESGEFANCFSHSPVENRGPLSRHSTA